MKAFERIVCGALVYIFITHTICYPADTRDHTSHYFQQTVLLTGAAGFIGSNFLEYMFTKYPDYYFIVLDALTYAGNKENIPHVIRNSERFEFHHGSINDEDLVNSLMQRSDLVVHFAAETHVTRSIYDDEIFFITDVLGTRIMMQSLLHHADKVKRFIHISTSEVCGTAAYEPMDENHPTLPRTPYAAAKAGAEKLVYAYMQTYDLPIVILRPFNNYGPRQHKEKMIPHFITTAINNEPMTIHGDGKQSRDWIHVADVCRAIDLTLHKKDFSTLKNQIIHIGSGKATTVLEIAKKIEELLFTFNTGVTFVEDRPGQLDKHISSTQKAYTLLGWKPEISLEKGLESTVQWYLHNRKRWETMDDSIMTPEYINKRIKRKNAQPTTGDIK